MLKVKKWFFLDLMNLMNDSHEEKEEMALSQSQMITYVEREELDLS